MSKKILPTGLISASYFLSLVSFLLRRYRWVDVSHGVPLLSSRVSRFNHQQPVAIYRCLFPSCGRWNAVWGYRFFLPFFLAFLYFLLSLFFGFDWSLVDARQGGLFWKKYWRPPTDLFPAQTWRRREGAIEDYTSQLRVGVEKEILFDLFSAPQQWLCPSYFFFIWRGKKDLSFTCKMPLDSIGGRLKNWWNEKKLIGGGVATIESRRREKLTPNTFWLIFFHFNSSVITML